MLPSILSEQVLHGLKSFITTGYETQTPLFEGMFSRFVNQQGKLFKGPYLSVDLPFRQGMDSRDYFSQFKTAFPPYLHQEQAWQRISSNKDAMPTIVATGTGSGKTECFLYPVLEHCALAQEKGIKAIVIYPMNALATDQAKRFAKEINKAAALKGNVRVGLFVGGDEGDSGSKQMQPGAVITDKHVLRETPPDILLTNYKMLDFLLIRPKDQKLWKHNTAETLKYLIVDELHTFDGAQGTDLSCLIRRMKARLKTPEQHLICVGTSATLGDDSAIEGLTGFASKVFQADFDVDSVIGETRLTADEFIDGVDQAYSFFLPFNFEQMLDWASYSEEEEYLLAQFKLLFPNLPVKDISNPAWRVKLGTMLKEHQLFRILLRLLTTKAYPVDDLVESFLKLFPVNTSAVTAQNLIYALCSLAAWARSEDDKSQPWVYLRVQLWLRELRRIVVPLKQPSVIEGNTERPLPHELCFYDDLKNDKSMGIYLPLVQCTQCHATAWAGVKPMEQNTLTTELRLIYNAFFGHSPELVMLFPVDDDNQVPDSQNSKGWVKHLCSQCGTLQQSKASCHACGHDRLLKVYQPDSIREKKTKGTTRLISEHHCPMCMHQHSMIVFGARSASLSSVAISQSYASHFNDDKQLITFSDNVQDAAHRAGFFAARTWQHNIRMAISQAIPDEATIPLEAFYDRLSVFWRDASLNPLAMDDARYISEFIAPNMLYYDDYQALVKDSQLPNGSNLIAEINTRLEWEILSEFGYRGSVGRSLQRTGTASLGFEIEPVRQSADKVLFLLREEFGLQHVTEKAVTGFITGLLLYLRGRGAIFNRLLESYVNNGGKNFLLTKLSYLPAFAPQTPAPIFLCNKNSHPEFDCLIYKKGLSWYQNWCRKTLLDTDTLEITQQNIEASIYELVLPVLVGQGLLIELETSGHKLWGLNPARLYISKQLTKFETQQKKDFYVPEALNELVEGMPSLITSDREHLTQADNIGSNWLRQIYNRGEIKRVIAHEHTGLLDRKRREAIENDFMQGDKPWSLNLLSATPTLEMGIDIGDLSSVLLCSVPPAQANYLQRIGRAGRRDGNAFNLTVAQGAPHDLHFYADPREMMAGAIDSPDVYLNATAVMSRQLIAFCMDNWVASGIGDTALPGRMSQVLNSVERGDVTAFPYTFIEFVGKHATDLLERFLDLFGDQLNKFTQAYLKNYLLGSGDLDGSQGLKNYLINFLFELVKERNSLKEKIDQLRKHLKKLEKLPKDESVSREIDEVQIESEGLSAILRKINGKQVLNFFTDEGLLPNYAFPESGVTLRSVIYRRKREPKEGESPFENDVFEYERAGSSAISELAPESTFYAGGRKVSIQQVDLKLSPIEQWRFCPTCHYSALDLGSHEAACPRCQNPMWADSGQSLQMVRMRQVMANTSDKDSRIGDDSDDREPVFYSKQLLPDFDPKDTEFAYALKSEAFPFGFEFIRKVDFREVNFGQYGEADEEKLIGGESLSRPGFRLCKHCGMVQDKHKEQNHAYSCSSKNKQSEDSIIDCLYLYREFNSEALRILLPVSSAEGADTYLNSFIAGLQLGLKRKFGGKVDHLRAMSYSAPIPNMEARRQFLMIYDSVPGGTGYLQDLMSKPENLLEVFRMARDVMVGCGCNHTDSDGCYHCLYAYRNSHGMESTSRNVAVDLFSNILDLAEKIERVEGIETIPTNPTMDSELEARFIEAIRRFGLKQKLELRIYPQIVKGKPGYFLQVQDRDYLIELQVPIGERQGVLINSKPDFVINAARAEDDFLPIAIFMDGYEYHQHSVTEDTLKRLALVESGGYYQWSLTWADVNEQFAKSHSVSRNPFNENQNEILGAQKKQLFDQFGIAHLRNQMLCSPFEQLMAFLQEPEPRAWQKMVFSHALGWFDTNLQSADFVGKITSAYKFYGPSTLAEQFAETSGADLFGGLGIGQENDPLTIVCKVPMLAVQTLEPELASLSVFLENSTEAKQLALFKPAWHGFLRTYNLFQFLPRSGFFTSEGGKAGAYEALAWRKLAGKADDLVASQPMDEALNSLLELALEELHEAVRELAERGLPLPALEYELLDSIGEILAEAEFCWEGFRIVGLLEEQMDCADLFKKAGWDVVQLDADGEWLMIFEAMINEDAEMSLKPKVAISADFFSAFSRLPNTQQSKVSRFITKFQQNPLATGINYERIRDASDTNMRSVRIDQAYRGIVLSPESGNVYMLLWVDHHDEAYDWARRHSCKINAATGSIQVYESEKVDELINQDVAPDQASTPSLFLELKDKELMRLGVPEDLLGLVRTVKTDSELDAIEHRIPVEAYEGLFLYAAGSRYDEIINEREFNDQSIDTEDFETALNTLDSQSRFVVVEDELELQAMLNAPLQKWRVFLHPSQRKLITGIKNGAVRVLGGAGTGKTVVAMHRAKWLANQLAGENKKILFTTFTRNLATDIENNLRSICSPETMKRIEVINLDKWVSQYLNKRKYSFGLLFDFDDRKKLWEKALDVMPSELNLPEAFYRDEWDKVIQPQSIETLDEYKRASRIGRGTSLKRAERIKVWKVFDEYRSLLNRNKLKEVDDAYRDVAGLLANEANQLPYAGVVVDEAQDMSTQAFNVLRQIIPEGPNDLFIVGDGHQRIYGRNKVVLSHCGINIRGRAKKLRINYRTTEEIRASAVNLLTGLPVDDLDGELDNNDGYKSLTHGNPPQIECFKDAVEQADFVVRYLKDIQDRGHLPIGNICIVARITRELVAIESALLAAGVGFERVKANSSDQGATDEVRTATMHRVKGLEFDQMIIASVNEGIVPLSYAVLGKGDKVEARQADLEERALLYVAMTRAMRHVVISSYGEPSPYL